MNPRISLGRVGLEVWVELFEPAEMLVTQFLSQAAEVQVILSLVQLVPFLPEEHSDQALATGLGRSRGN